MSQELEAKAAPHRIEVIDPIPILDTGRFEQIQRIASIMARSSLTPAHLRETAVVDEDGNRIYERGKAVVEGLPYDAVFANCFLIVNQALRWGIDPFVAASCTSVVSGRLCYEGKLVAGVLSAKLGIELNYEWNDLKGDAFGITVSGRTQKRGELKSISGTVGEWKTTRKGSPWAVTANHRRMLVYRGNREWARIYMPSIMLGIYTDDEIESLEQRRAIEPVKHALGKPREPQEIMEDIQADLKASMERTRPDAPAEEAGPVDENPTQDQASASTSGEGSTMESIQPEAATTEPGKAQDGAGESQDSPPETTVLPERTDTNAKPEDGNGGTGAESVGKQVSGKDGAPSESAPVPTIPEEPTRAEDYEAFWVKCLAVAEDRKDASAEWAGQRMLRTRLQVEMETVARCKAMVDRDFPKEG